MKYEVFWKNLEYKPRKELRKDIKCDYLIVGGGITGVSLAYFLSKSKAGKVVLIEKDHIASGATGKAAGTLVTRGESDLSDIIKKHGRKKGVEYWLEVKNSLDYIRRIISDEKIECDVEIQDTLYCGYKNNNYNDLYKEYDLEKSIEKVTRFLHGGDLIKELNTTLFNHAILSRNHGLSLNPLKFTQNLSKIAEKLGVEIYENTSLIRFSKNIAETQHGDITFKKIILAIDSYHPNEKVKNLKSTIVVTKPFKKSEIIKIGFMDKKGIFNKKIVWDSRKRYNYFKLTKDNRLLVGFGGIIVHKRHRKIDPHFPHLKTMEVFMKKLFPHLNIKFDYAWSGTFGVTDDFDPIVEFKRNSISISGAGTQVVCFMASKYVSERILGKKSNLTKFFNG